MRAIGLIILGLLLSLNGAAMLAEPAARYRAVPGVAETGPLNSHFVRDIGAAYLACGAALAAAARTGARAAALVAAGFLALHAVVHLADAVFGAETLSGLARDIPAVFLPPVLAFWLAAARPNPRGDIR